MTYRVLLHTRMSAQESREYAQWILDRWDRVSIYYDLESEKLSLSDYYAILNILTDDVRDVGFARVHYFKCAEDAAYCRLRWGSD